jgi:hypothetical protein
MKKFQKLLNEVKSNWDEKHNIYMKIQATQQALTAENLSDEERKKYQKKMKELELELKEYE